MKLLTLLFIFYSLYVTLGNGTEQKGAGVARGNDINPYAMMDEGQSLLKEGDLVVRLNRDPSSQFIRNLNRHDRTYSHSGIVIYENGYPYIYHMVMGDENPDGKLKKDSLTRFCNPRKNMAYGIYRYDLSTAEFKKLKTIVYDWYAKGIRFDADFNLSTDDKMYCSEMISKALEKATGNRIRIETTRLTATEAGLFSLYSHRPYAYTSKQKVVSIDELYTNSYCHLVKKYSYQRSK
jgi:hypothetical protein